MEKLRGVAVAVFVLVVALAALAQGCRCRAEDRVDGVIESPTPLKTPIGDLDACAVRVQVQYVRNTGSSSPRSVQSESEQSGTRYASGATFVVGGKRLLLAGSGGTPSFLAFRPGGTWGWGTGAPPPGLRGWGTEHDRMLAVASDQAPPGNVSRIWFTEEYLPCGVEVGLRGVVVGDRFALRPEEGWPGGQGGR
jgi:hypothetical protein